MYTFSKTRRQLMREAQRGLSIGPIELEREKKKERERKEKKEKSRTQSGSPFGSLESRGKKKKRMREV
jgi:hypothetical protein